MTNLENQARSIFLAALEHAPERWPAMLAEACSDNAELRAQVESLLAAHQALGSIHGGGALAATATMNRPLLEGPGTQIGPYKLMEQIGEGGMGLVFVAEQHAPVRRKVALKVIKPGMDTRDVIARFEAERQALALMDHPNIARVLDAGATASGRPYFVMELVKGTPITEYCDENRLSPRERLELFTHVCHAVQHAHQKGIIHRDIKPSNVLVASHDGHPVVKVIDFGVAKAIGQQLTDRTIYTAMTQMVGTPLYMSPEQAGMSSLDIDTRTDIYSLGVLLYELLTGTTPFDKDRLKQAAFEEIRRIIREEEPPKPSTRLSALSSPHAPRAEADGHVPRSVTATLASIAACRHTEPARLAKLVRGELDWIVMKALEKDRNRRYETASGLALDLQRYLNDEPVHACPPSTTYRFYKFARRNQAAIAAAVMIVVALLLGLVGTTWQAVRATRAEGVAQERLQAERKARQETDYARQAADRDRLSAQRHEATAVAEAAKAKSTLKLLQEMLATGGNRGKEYTVRQMLDDFSGKLDRLSLNDSETEAQIREIIGTTYRLLSCWEEGEIHLRRAIALQREASGEQRKRIVKNLVVCAWCVFAQGRQEEGKALAREAIALCQTSDTDTGTHLEALRTIQHFTWISGKHEEADVVAREALAIAGDRDFPVLSSILHDLADSTTSRGRYAEAESIARRALDLSRRTSNDSGAIAWAQVTLARCLVLQRKDEEGVALAREALAYFRTRQPDSHFSVRAALNQLGVVVGRARTSALRSQWEQAAMRYSQVVDAFPLGDVSFEHACLRLMVGDEESYEQFCTHLAADATLAHDPSRAYIAARICSLNPNPILPTNRILEWARRAITTDPKNVRYMHTLGAAYYRCSQFQDAVWELEESNKADWSDSGKAQNWLFLAMAEYRLGNTGPAQQWLHKATNHIDRLTQSPDGAAIGVELPDWLGLQVLRREAQEVLGKNSE